MVAVKIRNVGFDFPRRREIVGLALHSSIVVADYGLITELLLAGHALHFSVVEHEPIFACLLRPHLALRQVAASAVYAVVVRQIGEQPSAFVRRQLTLASLLVDNVAFSALATPLASLAFDAERHGVVT